MTLADRLANDRRLGSEHCLGWLSFLTERQALYVKIYSPDDYNWEHLTFTLKKFKFRIYKHILKKCSNSMKFASFVRHLIIAV